MTQQGIDQLARALRRGKPKEHQEAMMVHLHQWLHDIEAVIAGCQEASERFDAGRFREVCGVDIDG